MFNKTFETIARKQLTENAFDRWCMKRQYVKADKLGCIVRFPNGTEGFDIVKYHVHNLKKGAFMLGVVYPAAAIIGHVLGNMNSKN